MCALVTGVQTCALPICQMASAYFVEAPKRVDGVLVVDRGSRDTTAYEINAQPGDVAAVDDTRVSAAPVPANATTLAPGSDAPLNLLFRSEEHTSELQSLMRI